MIEPWILAVGGVITGVLSGVVGAALVRRIVTSGREEVPEMADAARAAALFVFAFFAVVGLVVALGAASPDRLETVPERLLVYSPRILAAGLIVIIGRATALALAGIAGRALLGSSDRSRGQAITLVRYVVTGSSLVLAMSQLQLDTTILMVFTSSVLFALAGTFVLLVGLGGRSMSGELATGRYLHRLLRPGERIQFGDVRGRVRALHPASVEVVCDDESIVHIPNSVAFASAPRVLPGGSSEPVDRGSWLGRMARHREPSEPIEENLS